MGVGELGDEGGGFEGIRVGELRDEGGSWGD